jgi:hypothetical protein
VVAHIVLLATEHTCRLHCAASSGTEDALDLEPASERETAAVVTDPVVFRDFVNAVALLVDRDVANAAEDDKVVFLVVAIVTDCALGVLLDNKAPLVRAELGEALVLHHFMLLRLLQLHQDQLVVYIVFLLLPHF